MIINLTKDILMMSFTIYSYIYFPVDCEAPPAPAHGHVATPHGTEFESIAVYSCEDGYDLSYPAYRTCFKSGKWSGHAPTCDPKRKFMRGTRELGQ